VSDKARTIGLCTDGVSRMSRTKKEQEMESGTGRREPRDWGAGGGGAGTVGGGSDSRRSSRMEDARKPKNARRGI
jgi:hypothetical protein